MQTSTVQKIEIPIWVYGILLLIIGLVIFQFVRIGRLKKRNKNLVHALEKLLADTKAQAKKTLEVLAKLNEDDTATSPDEALQSMDLETVSPPAAAEPEQEKPADIIPIIPASLRYKIQPLEGKFSFKAISTREGSNDHVRCDLETDQLVFRLASDGQEPRLTETRNWPVSEKEIGTILNTMLQTPKT